MRKSIHYYGFTLIELLVTIAVVAVLATIAVPSFSTLIKNNRLAMNINDLTVDLALARSESAKRGTRVTVCASSDGTSCTGSWSSGRIIFVDKGTIGTVDGTDEIIRKTSALTGNNTLTASGFSNTGYIQYRPRGLTDSSASYKIGIFKLCDSRTGAFGRKITIDLTGRATLEKNISCP